MSSISETKDREADFDRVMRRHGIEVLPNAREMTMLVCEDLSRAARLVRQKRSMVATPAYIFSPVAILRTANEKP